MRIIFESKNKKLQGAKFLSTPEQISTGLNKFQRSILEQVFKNSKLKIANITMLDNKMAVDIAKRS